MSSTLGKESWSSRLGVIMAVAGSAVGLGNFLRFPGLVADRETGGGAFLVAYFISLLLVGIPVCWMEWTLGRHGGVCGYNSSPGIFHAVIKKPWGKYVGMLGFMVPVCVYLYYVVIESWCLGYAWHSFNGNLALGQDSSAYQGFFASFTGAGADGAALGWKTTLPFFLVVFVLNFIVIYRGISKGIEWVCKIGMPLLIVIALVLLVRVMTLGTPNPAHPELSVWNGLGYMWNPDNMMKGLLNPVVWLKAAGQIFFTLSVGFGVIITYASYLREKDDVVLSGLTASSANEFCEVALGGLITVPAAYAFLGATAIVSSSFALGFNVLPQVFAGMPFGHLFAGLFFVLLFLAAVTSSLSMLQPGIAFLEEGLGLNRRQSVTFLGLITALGSFMVIYFSKDLKALDTMDFWIGTVGIFVQGMLLVLVFNFVFGVERGWADAHKGAELKIPWFYKPIMRWITPVFLGAIFIAFVLTEAFGWNFSLIHPEFKPSAYITDLTGTAEKPADRVALMSVIFLATVGVFLTMLIHQAGERWERRSPVPKPLKAKQP